MTQDVLARSVWNAMSPHPVEETFCKGEVECLELFAGKARISEAFAKRGRGVLQPRDIRFGHDLRRKEVQEEVLKDIVKFKPGMVWLAPPCTVWCGFSHLNYSPQELRRMGKREMALVNFTSDVMALQKLPGGIVIVENPRASDLWRVPVIQRYLESNMFFAVPVRHAQSRWPNAAPQTNVPDDQQCHHRL